MTHFMSDVFGPAWNLVKRDMGDRGYQQIMDPLGSYLDPDDGIYQPESGFRMPVRPEMKLSPMDMTRLIGRDTGLGGMPQTHQLMAENKKLISDLVMMQAEVQQLRQILDGLMAGGGVRGMGGSYMTEGAMADEGGRMDFMEGEGIYDMLREMYGMPDQIQDEEYRRMLMGQ